jgi:hypothetical protein
MAVTECQGCGAWNDASRTLCVLCGTPLAETDEWDAAAELPPLPPLPDGGLRASMPTWLRDPPAAAPVPATPPGNAPPILASTTTTTNATATASSLGPRADPRTFLTDDDFPPWLRDLAARRAEVERSPAEISGTPPRQEPAPRKPAPPSAWLGSAEPATSVATPAEPEPTPPPPADTPLPVAPEVAPVAHPTPAPSPEDVPPAVAPRTPEERRGRQPWETFLLVVLFIGVVVAALWALVANGILGPGL